ncbi:MAG TPA: divalent-cation tolerance protein CutA [Polyangia bacterium]
MTPAPRDPPVAGDFVVVFVTAPSAKVAANLAKALVIEKLAACVNILPGLRSIYTWEGKVCDEEEVLCVLKTRRALFETVRDRVTALHPYQVPEIIALPLVDGSAPYLAWLRDETHAP